jgi:5-formyltetrahydrofolate cyclo-ligase
MSDAAAEEDTMASLNAAKQHLRAAMKQKLKALSHDSIVSQSTGVAAHGRS